MSSNDIYQNVEQKGEHIENNTVWSNMEELIHEYSHEFQLYFPNSEWDLCYLHSEGLQDKTNDCDRGLSQNSFVRVLLQKKQRYKQSWRANSFHIQTIPAKIIQCNNLGIFLQTLDFSE